MGEKRGRVIEEHIYRTHGQSYRQLGFWFRGRGRGWGRGNAGGKMETTVLE